MLLDNNSLKVIKLIGYVDELKNVDKVRLAIYILENKSFNTDFDIDKLVDLLKNILNKLEPKSSKVITNFAKYQNLLFISSKYMELNFYDKKRFSVELLFNIYETDFNNEEINVLINEQLDIYGYCYGLNIISKKD